MYKDIEFKAIEFLDGIGFLGKMHLFREVEIYQCGGCRSQGFIRRGFFDLQWLPCGRLRGTGVGRLGVPEMVALLPPLPPVAAPTSTSSPRCVSGFV